MRFVVTLFLIAFSASAQQPRYFYGDRWVDTGATSYVAANGNDNIAVRGSKELPFLTLTNALAASQAGDTVKVLYQGYQVITNSWHLPDDFTLEAGGFKIFNKTRRVTPNGSDPGDNTLDGPVFVPGNRNKIKHLRCEGIPNGNTMQNAPLIGTIYFDKNPYPFSDLYVEDVSVTNMTVAWYCRHTNACSGKFVNCDFQCYKNPGFVSYGPHDFKYFNCRFVADGPDTIWLDSIVGQAVGFRQLSGTNFFYGCYFRGTNPTNSLSTLGDTNAVGFEIESGENAQNPVGGLFGCRMESSNTNTSPVSPSWDILNGQQFFGESSTLYVSGCTFDRTKVFGPIIENVLPMTGGVVSSQDTNQFLTVNSGTFDSCVAIVQNGYQYILDRSALPTIKFTNACGYYMTGSAGNWSFFDNFDSVSATNKYGGWFTNGIFTSANSALNTNNNVSVRYFIGPVTNVLSIASVTSFGMGNIIKSNTLASIPASLSPGDVYLYSSNGIAYRILVGPTGTRTTNTW